MPVVVVEDDKILRFIQCLLDPNVVPARAAALADYLICDISDVDGWIAGVQSACGDFYPAEVRMVPDQNALRAALPDADAVVTEALEIGEEELALAPKLKVVQNFGLDTRNIDLEACARAGVQTPVFRRRINGVVGEHVIALMLAVGRKICETNGALDFASLEALGYKPGMFDTDHISGGNWARVTGLKNLQGSTLGALGLGEVGREVANRAKAMGMHILYHQRRQLPPEVEAQWNAEYASFDEMLERADFVSIHVPLNDASRGMVDAAAFQRMKDGAILINASRAHIVDRDALIAALNSGRLGGAGFDVQYAEPLTGDEPLRDYPNVVLSPHIAVGPRTEALADMEEIIANLAGAVNQGN
jgi:phosphoglycerate dehydrogenase-like enzyme